MQFSDEIFEKTLDIIQKELKYFTDERDKAKAQIKELNGVLSYCDKQIDELSKIAIQLISLKNDV